MSIGKSDPLKRVNAGSTDRAVSPVIGVILMVAITVILAAVIGVFVMGLGDEIGQASPSNSIGVTGDYVWDDTAEPYLEFDALVSHDSGDSVAAEDVDVLLRVDGATEDRVGLDVLYTEDELSVGDTVEFDETEFATATTGEPTDDVTVQLVHTPSDSIIAEGELDE